MQTRLIATCALALFAAGGGVVGDASASPCSDIGGTDVGNNGDGTVFEITSDTVWGDGSNPSPICLDEIIFVSSGAVLEILPGTIVRGQPRRGAVGSLDDVPGALVITQGSQLIADGSASSPIVMTTAAVDNDDDGVCDDLDGDGFKDIFPGFQPNNPPGCAASQTCGTDETPANAMFCDDTPTTAPLAPLDQDGFSNVQLWGGLVLEGYAPTNLANKYNTGFGYGTGFVEGLTLPGTPAALATCGGGEPHDNSGTMRYVSVRHAGDEIDVDNELNGVTVCAVGDGTIMEFMEVYANFDDGFEWFGGTVNPNHLVVTYVGDDSFDIDWGYTGALQFLFANMTFFNENGGGAFGSASGDRMGEWDGDDFLERGGDVNVRLDGGPPGTETDNTPWPLSNPYIFNLTGIGSTPDGTNPASNPASDNYGLFMRHGFAGQVLNSLVVNTGTRSCLTIDTDTGESTAGHDAIDNVNADLIRMVSSTCEDGGALATAAQTASDNGDAYAMQQTMLGCSANSVNAGTAGLAQEDPGFSPQGDSDSKLNAGILAGSAYDPRPTGTPIDCGVQPQDAGLDRAATYRGAFEASTPELWTTGWTVLNQAELLAD